MHILHKCVCICIHQHAYTTMNHVYRYTCLKPKEESLMGRESEDRQIEQLIDVIAPMTPQEEREAFDAEVELHVRGGQLPTHAARQEVDHRIWRFKKGPVHFEIRQISSFFNREREL